jgi:hypothetical protein
MAPVHVEECDFERGLHHERHVAGVLMTAMTVLLKLEGSGGEFEHIASGECANAIPPALMSKSMTRR